MINPEEEKEPVGLSRGKEKRKKMKGRKEEEEGDGVGSISSRRDLAIREEETFPSPIFKRGNKRNPRQGEKSLMMILHHGLRVGE